MTDRDDETRPRKRKRKRKRKRAPRRRRRKRKPHPPDFEDPDRGEEVIEVGHGEFAVVTVPHAEGPTVVHRFESKEEARKQYERNVEEDKPLVDVGEAEN